jgi:hypothetical protein
MDVCAAEMESDEEASPAIYEDESDTDKGDSIPLRDQDEKKFVENPRIFESIEGFLMHETANRSSAC